MTKDSATLAPLALSWSIFNYYGSSVVELLVLVLAVLD